MISARDHYRRELDVIRGHLPTLCSILLSRVPSGDDRTVVTVIFRRALDGQGRAVGAPLPETISLLAVLRRVVELDHPDRARAVLSWLLDQPDVVERDPAATELADAPPDAATAEGLGLIWTACAEPTDIIEHRRVEVLDGVPLTAAFEAIRNQRPWPENPLYLSIQAGRAEAGDIARYLGQWSRHLMFGTSLFAAMYGQCDPGSAEQQRIAAKLRLGVDPAADRSGPARDYWSASLRELRDVLTRRSAGVADTELPETRAHIALMTSIASRRAIWESAAAVLAVKKGFPALCVRLADALRDHYHVPESNLEFFRWQGETADEGADELAIVADLVDSPLTARVRTAFRDGLVSYHLVLDGCIRAAGASALTPIGRVRPGAEHRVALRPARERSITNESGPGAGGRGTAGS
jgi:hypothetical protein